ncbi:MAG TPA: Rv3235 family protein [Kineosporiaceae bacterium]|nr:Rv3235 family protein [Kineosporiaceae bacterium]
MSAVPAGEAFSGTYPQSAAATARRRPAGSLRPAPTDPDRAHLTPTDPDRAHLTPADPGAGPAGAPRLRRLPVPVSQPRAALRVVRDDGPPIPPAQTVLALPLPLGVIPDADTGDDFAARRRTPGHALPDPADWARQFVQAAIEVTTGLRPASQLVRWTTDEIRTRLARRAELARRMSRRAAPRAQSAQPSTVRSTRVCIPRDGVAEACAVVSDGVRFRAVALRMEGLDGRWRVTSLELG